MTNHPARDILITMHANDVRAKYLAFFKERQHAVLPSSALVPENDPTTLFTGSGMQPLVPYLLGMEHPQGSRLTDSQKSFRAQDIEEVGDNRHTTFFEMLGNWSLGDYFKREQLRWFFEFLTTVVGIPPERLYVTVYAGHSEQQLPRDEESVRIWQELFAEQGITAATAEMITEEGGAARGMRGEGVIAERIFYYADKNWWSRQGPPHKMLAGEPGGPDSEVFYEFTDMPHDTRFGEHCHPNCDCGRFLEIGNSVFMEYCKTTDGTFEKLAKQNVDFGGGLERIAAASENTPDVFAISLFAPLIERIAAASGKPYRGNEYAFRVIADHMRAATFLAGDGVIPSNSERGYVLRRLIRRAVRHSDALGIGVGTLAHLSATVRDSYAVAYPELTERADRIAEVLAAEEAKFRKTLHDGARELRTLTESGTSVTAQHLFDIYTTHGYPVELSLEELHVTGAERDALIKGFEEAMDEHRVASRAGVAKKFGGHGLILDTGEVKAATEEEVVIVTKLHTATHMLQSALREVLGPSVRQAGSDITAERTRFDFTFDRKLTDDEVRAVEQLLNDKIAEDLPVAMFEMSKADGEKTGALSFFRAKYGDRVQVWRVGHDWETAFSKEFCGGPHVQHTAEIGRVRVTKQEAVAAGIRRIRVSLVR